MRYRPEGREGKGRENKCALGRTDGEESDAQDSKAELGAKKEKKGEPAGEGKLTKRKDETPPCPAGPEAAADRAAAGVTPTEERAQ